MRTQSIACAVALAALVGSGVSGVAWGTEAPKTKEAGLAAPALPASSPSGGAGTIGGGRSDEPAGLLNLRRGLKVAKWWEVGAAWETHGLIRQNDLGGAGSSKLLNYAYAYARLDVTGNDRLSLRGGFYQHLIADQGETGVRADDLVLTYTHRFLLPWQLVLRASLSVTGPISFASQKENLITAPTATLWLERSWRGLSVDLRVFGGGYIVRYATAQGGNPNAKARLGAMLDVEYSFWFHKALSLGADIYTSYFWFYNVTNGGSAVMTVPGETSDQQYATQPVQQVYGGEVFARYTFPSFYGVKSELSVAYAQGDPTLGYTSLIHDGIAYIYGFYRRTSEVYGTILLRY